jgi:hypothetical protein
MSKITLKAILMGTVFIAAVVFSAISFCSCEILNGFGYILTATIPVTIWFLDDKENQVRDDKFLKLRDEVESYGMKVTGNPEWIFAITDASDHLLFGIHRSDGSIEWGAGVPTPIKNKISELGQRIEKLENCAIDNASNKKHLKGDRATEGAIFKG